VSAWLHYHPKVFSVSEKYLDWKRPLWRYWAKRSIFEMHGVQKKNIQDTRFIVFNKVQRRDDLWGKKSRIPEESPAVFYLRHPVRIFLSREAYRARHDPERHSWKLTESNFDDLLSEYSEILSLYGLIKARRPSCLLAHEYFCLNHEISVAGLYRFLGLDFQGLPRIEGFFQHWKSGEVSLNIERDAEGMAWFVNPVTGEGLSGSGNFNPLRPISKSEIKNESWREIYDIDKLMTKVKSRLGDEIHAYYSSSDFSSNIELATGAPSRRSVGRLVPQSFGSQPA